MRAILGENGYRSLLGHPGCPLKLRRLYTGSSIEGEKGQGGILTSRKHELTIEIKAEARRLGFDLVGVTTPDPPPHLDVYKRWLALGRHGEMRYLERESAVRRRSDPHEILPQCRSILVVGMNYTVGEGIGPDPMVKIASYALGEDYHEVLIARLKILCDFISQKVGSPIVHRMYTDTGPILEREFAQRAGLGWIGKNTCLINPERGSYFLLGEVLLELELEPDHPFVYDRCGSCTRCVEACPTECILPDRTLDARRCLSYLSIELRGSIPYELRSSMGSWIFGCDICQQVCPWNLRFARSSQESAFLPRAFLGQCSLEDFLSLNEETFRSELRDSPLRRAKLSGILRNAAIVAGNRGDVDLIPSLEGNLKGNSEALVRAHAAWALGRIGGERALPVLREAYVREGDPSVRSEIESAIKAASSSEVAVDHES
jgi:epoxyqueuosine reductase